VELFLKGVLVGILRFLIILKPILSGKGRTPKLRRAVQIPAGIPHPSGEKHILCRRPLIPAVGIKIAIRR
jgi:hypothetical protein